MPVGYPVNLHPTPESSPIPVGVGIRDAGASITAPNIRGTDVVLPYIKQGSSALHDVPKHVLLEYIPRMVHNRKFSFRNMCLRLDPSKPCSTLTKTFSGYGGMFVHPFEHRFLSAEECRRISSFPDQFEIPGDYVKWVNRLGNAVPPLMMRAVAARIRQLTDGAAPAWDVKGLSYTEILGIAWRLHQEPRAADAPTLISTFAGCGGSSLGYSIAGYRELLAVEWDDHAVETFEVNFPGVPVYHGDIADLSVEEMLETAGVDVGELDVFDGSPPCQGFSTAGKRQIDDDRNKLFMEFVRLLRGAQPRFFVAENVSGLVKGKMKRLFVEILQELRGCGYVVQAKLLNAMYFNVPQSRQRVIFIGVRKDVAGDLIGNAQPTAENRPITAGQALAGVELDDGELEFLRAVGAEKKAYRMWPLVKPGQSVDSIIPGEGFNAVKLDKHRPSPTVSKFTGHPTVYGLMHWDEPRRPTTAEFARLCSFPDEFAWPRGRWGPKITTNKAVERMGNSVPPLMMRAVAERLRRIAP